MSDSLDVPNSFNLFSSYLCAEMCLIIHYVDGETFGFLEGNSIAKEKWLLTVTAPICFGFVFFGQEIVFAHVCIC